MWQKRARVCLCYIIILPSNHHAASVAVKRLSLYTNSSQQKYCYLTKQRDHRSHRNEQIETRKKSRERENKNVTIMLIIYFFRFVGLITWVFDTIQILNIYFWSVEEAWYGRFCWRSFNVVLFSFWTWLVNLARFF